MAPSAAVGAGLGHRYMGTAGAVGQPGLGSAGAYMSGAGGLGRGLDGYASHRSPGGYSSAATLGSTAAVGMPSSRGRTVRLSIDHSDDDSTGSSTLEQLTAMLEAGHV